MKKVVCLLVVMVVVFHLTSVADASFAKKWKKAKLKAARAAHGAGRAVAHVFTGSHHKKPTHVTPKPVQHPTTKAPHRVTTTTHRPVTTTTHRPVTTTTHRPVTTTTHRPVTTTTHRPVTTTTHRPVTTTTRRPVTTTTHHPVTTKPLILPTESIFGKTSAIGSESSGQSSYSYYTGGSPASSSHQSAHGSRTHRTSNVGYGSDTYGSSSDQGSEWTSSGGSSYGSRTHRTASRPYRYGSRTHRTATAGTPTYGRRNGASTYDQYSDDWTSSSGNGRSNNYGSSSYSKESPYSDTYWYSED